MRKKSFKMSDIIEITATFKIFSAKNISKFAFQHVLMICANILYIYFEYMFLHLAKF